MLEALTIESFQPLVGDRFAVRPQEGEPFDATLVDVSQLGPPGSGLGRRERPFSLILAGAGQAEPAQGIFAVSHPRLGDLDIFLVPVGRDAGGVRYEAVFT